MRPNILFILVAVFPILIIYSQNIGRMNFEDLI